MSLQAEIIGWCFAIITVAATVWCVAGVSRWFWKEFHR